MAAALVLSVGNTTKLWADARAKRRERERRLDAEDQLARLVKMLEDHGPNGVMHTGIFDELRDGIDLGVQHGVLKRTWNAGQMQVRLATISDSR